MNYELWGEKIYIFHFTQQIQQVKTHIKPKYNQTFVWFKITLVGSVMGAEYHAEISSRKFIKYIQPKHINKKSNTFIDDSTD